MKTILVLIIGVIIGFSARSIIQTKPSKAWHWKAVKEYRAHILDSASYTPDAQTGLARANVPDCPTPSLAALVVAGELEYMDIVLPTIPYTNREAQRYWMSTCAKSSGILYAEGNTRYAVFAPQGDQPLHLNIWFEPAARSEVLRMLSTMQQMVRK